MKNLLRLLLLSLVTGVIFFCYNDESPYYTWKTHKNVKLPNQILTKEIHLGLAQKRMLRLKLSADENRSL